MKKFNYYRISLIMLLSAFVLFQSSCTEDGGYYDKPALERAFAGNIYEYLESKPGVFDSLLAAIDRTGLKTTLTDSNVTLFAVTNPSFQLALNNLNRLRKQSDKDPLFIENIDYNHLDTMTAYYIIRGKLPTDSMMLQDGLALSSVRFGYPMHGKVFRASASGYSAGGPEIMEFSNTKRSKFIRNWSIANTSSSNITTANGIVHVISPDHIFGFDEFVTRLTFNPPPPNLIKLMGGTLTVNRENGGGPKGGEGSLKVIDGDDHTKYLAELNGNAWLRFEFTDPVVSGCYTISSANDFPDRDPRAWTFEGSNDGNTWVELDRRFNQTFESRYLMKVYYFQNDAAYKYYRLNITEIRGGNVFQFSEWTINEPKK